MFVGGVQSALIAELLTIGNTLASSLSILRLEYPKPLPVGGFDRTKGLITKIEDLE